MRTNSKRFLLILLGMLSAFGPFITDMYLPTLPSMTKYFNTSAAAVQLGLTTSMIGLASGQMFFGPLSDRYGRRLPLLISMWLFIIATIGCIFTHDINQFLVWRFVQGIAGSGGIVISRSIATDKYAGHELVKMLAIIGAINGIAPVTAPVIGGALTDSIGWKGIFTVLFIIGCILIIGCYHLNESLPSDRRNVEKWSNLFRSFATVLKNKQYIGYVLQLGFAQGILFSNISSSPFIMQQHYGFSAFMFSLFFGINSIAIGASAALSVKFRKAETATYVGCLGMVITSIAELIALSCNCDFWIYESLIIILLFAMGMTFTTSTTLAMNAERKNAGVASALLGTICFAFGGIVSPLVSIGNIMTTTGIIFVVSAMCSLISVKFLTQKTN